jgi:hypothetical protein
MDPTKLPDWRLHVAVEVASVTSRGPGPGPKAGNFVILMGQTRSSSEGHLLLPVVSPERLALHAAIKDVAVARGVWAKLAFKAYGDPSGPKQLEAHQWPLLFDFFEAALGAAVSSFQSLESYANRAIEEKLQPTNGTYNMTRKGGVEVVSWPDLQQRATTEVKYGEVLPSLFGTAIAKGRKPWQQFVELKRVRDAAMHLKTKDLRVPGGAVDRQTVFYQLLNHQPQAYVRTALAMMKYFQGGEVPSWMTHAESQLEAVLAEASAEG